MNILTAHPRLATFSIGLAITFVIGATIGMLNYSQAITPHYQQYFC
jgi:hypothetical protein